LFRPQVYWRKAANPRHRPMVMTAASILGETAEVL